MPVEVGGGLFSLGDTHAAQGDGEVCGTAIESPCNVVARIELEKDAHLAAPRFRTAGPSARHVDAKGYEATTGIGPDLFQAARGAVSGMIDLLTKRHAPRRVDAYMLCTICDELRISEIVDVPTGWFPSTSRGRSSSKSKRREGNGAFFFRPVAIGCQLSEDRPMGALVDPCSRSLHTTRTGAPV